jgi:hypothetical protein
LKKYPKVMHPELKPIEKGWAYAENKVAGLYTRERKFADVKEQFVHYMEEGWGASDMPRSGTGTLSTLLSFSSRRTVNSLQDMNMRLPKSILK